jgi:hypothetical protein
MIVGIKDIYLYTGLTPTGGNDSALAIQWLDENNIEYSHLWYSDPAQHAEVFNALNTWGIGTFSDFPFVIYDEMNDDYTTVRRSLIGLNAITESNLAELAELSKA